MTNRPDLISLPTGLQSAGDPVQTNPFAVDNPRHQVWNDATRVAEQESCRARSDLAKIRIESIEALAAAMVDFAAGQFDVWARRGVHVVWSNEDIRAYDTWLHRNAESWLEVALQWCPTPIRQEALLNELKLRLMGRLEWWMGEARRYLAAQNLNGVRPDCAADANDGGEQNEFGLGGTDSGAASLKSSAAKTAVGPAEKRSAEGTGSEYASAHRSVAALPIRRPEARASDWEEIAISFISDERVQISIGSQLQTRNYEEMGFGSRKNGVPLSAWAALRALAEAGGVLSIASDGRRWAELEKRMQEIRKVLRGLFELSGDPVPYLKKSRNSAEFGYRTRFKIGCRRSYES